MEHTIQVIATIHNDYTAKFGIPRQSGLVPQVRSRVVFAPEFRNPEALRGLEGFSHLWLIWQFSQAVREHWSPTVRPPRLGGNARMGVFATRSPFRPNPLGLSCVALEGLEVTRDAGTVLVVSGADLMDGTPIYDIKPYLPYADAHPEARGGFAAAAPDDLLKVEVPPALAGKMDPAQLEALGAVLAQDPRPAYQRTSGRSYGMDFGGWQVRFTVDGSVLRVTGLDKV